MILSRVSMKFIIKTSQFSYTVQAFRWNSCEGLHQWLLTMNKTLPTCQTWRSSPVHYDLHTKKFPTSRISKGLQIVLAFECILELFPRDIKSQKFASKHTTKPLLAVGRSGQLCVFTSLQAIYLKLFSKSSIYPQASHRSVISWKGTNQSFTNFANCNIFDLPTRILSVDMPTHCWGPISN